MIFNIKDFGKAYSFMFKCIWLVIFVVCSGSISEFINVMDHGLWNDGYRLVLVSCMMCDNLDIPLSSMVFIAFNVF